MEDKVNSFLFNKFNFSISNYKKLENLDQLLQTVVASECQIDSDIKFKPGKTKNVIVGITGNIDKETLKFIAKKVRDVLIEKHGIIRLSDETEMEKKERRKESFKRYYESHKEKYNKACLERYVKKKEKILSKLREKENVEKRKIKYYITSMKLYEAGVRKSPPRKPKIEDFDRKLKAYSEKRREQNEQQTVVIME